MSNDAKKLDLKVSLIVPNKMFNCTRKRISSYFVIAKYILNKLQTKIYPFILSSYYLFELFPLSYLLD